MRADGGRQFDWAGAWDDSGAANCSGKNGGENDVCVCQGDKSSPHLAD
jgi:hypothetical protein